MTLDDGLISVALFHFSLGTLKLEARFAVSAAAGFRLFGDMAHTVPPAFSAVEFRRRVASQASRSSPRSYNASCPMCASPLDTARYAFANVWASTARALTTSRGSRISSARPGNQIRCQPPELRKSSLPKSAFSSCQLTWLGHGRLAIALREHLKLVPEVSTPTLRSGMNRKV